MSEMKRCTRKSCGAPDGECCGAAVFVQHWYHGIPLPDGARHADGLAIDSHHRHHSSLIKFELVAQP